MSAKGRRRGLKRLELWLPEDHVVWSLSSGDRAKIAREWLNLGAKIEALEKAVARLEQKTGAPENKSVPGEKPMPVIDPEAFFEI